MEKTKTTKSKTGTEDFVDFQEIIEDNFKKSSEITKQTLDTLTKTYNEQSEIIVDVSKKLVETMQQEVLKPNPDHTQNTRIFNEFKTNVEKVSELAKVNIKAMNDAILNQTNLAKETIEKFTKTQYSFDYTKYIDEYKRNIETANTAIIEHFTAIIEQNKKMDLTTGFEIYHKNVVEANEMVTKNITKVFDFYKKQYKMVTDLNKTYTDYMTNHVDTFTKMTKDAFESYWPKNWWID